MIKPDNTKIRKQFGENLRSLRKSRGYSQMKFADVIGSTQAAVSAWELGVREPEFSVIFNIADTFKVPVSSLIPLEESCADDDMTQKAVDMIHQNPRISDVLEKMRYFDENQIKVVVSVIDAISHETDTES